MEEKDSPSSRDNLHMTSSFFSRSQSINLFTPAPSFIAGFSLILSFLSAPTQCGAPARLIFQGSVKYLGNLSLLRVHPCGRIVVSVPGEFTQLEGE